MNTVCKEHEWVMEIPLGIVYCKKCLLRDSKRDFKINKNIEQINKQEWEDIWDEFKNTQGIHESFYFWLKGNYNAPTKK